MDAPPHSAPRAGAGLVRLLLLWLLGAVFVLAGTLKVRDPQLFTMQVRGFDILPDPYNALLALSLPWLEIFCGLAVITGLLRKGALVLLVCCLIGFVALLGWALATNRQVDCGCFGGAWQLGAPKELVLDVFLLAAGLWLLATPRTVKRAP